MTIKNNWEWEDSQLSSSEHDEMVLYLLDVENVKKLIPNIAQDEKQYKEAHLPPSYAQFNIDICSEVPIIYSPKGSYDSTGRVIIGYWDIVIDDEWRRYYIEVKPQIESFGAVLRQINRYCFYSDVNNVYLYTNDHRFDSQFEAQGIKILGA